MGEALGIPTTIMVTLMLGHLSHSRLTTKPANQVGWDYDTNRTISCSSDIGSNAITWYFTLFVTADNVTVAVGASLTPAYASLFQINQPNPEASNLVIPLTSNLTAGTYTCSDLTEAASAQHTVMPPDASSNNLTNSSKNGDVFYYTCAASFFGNDFMIPQFEFMRNSPGLAETIRNPVITKVGSKRLVRWTFVKTAECGFFTEMFRLYFSEPRGSLPSGSATNAPGIVWTINSIPPLNISCVPTSVNMSITVRNATNLLTHGETITCNAESSTPVNYTWTDLTYGNSSKGQQLQVWHNGTYQCNASTEQDGKIYSALKTICNLTVLILRPFPLFGPIAGGTRITFVIESGSDQIANISGVYIGDNLSAAIVNLNLQKQSFVVVSPPASDDLIQRPLQITVEVAPGPFNFTTDLYFTYRSNPEITNVSPNSFIVTGGTSINVSGSSLSSVANTLIQVILSVTRVNITENFMKTTKDSCEVTNRNGTEMVCKMPPVDIPKDFLKILDAIYGTNTTSSKENTSSSVLEVMGPNGIDRAIVYLGFILDGYRIYENINDVLPNTRIFYHSSPEINSSQKVYEYDPNTDGLFIIQGNHMTLGCRLSDYVVRVGNAICENVDLNDNALTVRLPKKEPQLTQNDTIVCGKYLNIRIIIGYKEYHYYCLKYKSYLALIIGVCVGVGGFLLLVTTIIGVICCCRKQRRGKPSNNDSNSQHQNSEISDQSRKELQNTSSLNDGYLRAIELE